MVSFSFRTCVYWGVQEQSSAIVFPSWRKQSVLVKRAEGQVGRRGEYQIHVICDAFVSNHLRRPLDNLQTQSQK